MDKLMISVIVPVYNVEDYIEKCVDSILGQTYQDFELILVNDGSTDSSYERILKYGTDSRITIINKPNTGQSDSRYQGLLFAKGEYVYFVDADDTIEHDTLKLYVENCNNGSADAVFARYRLIDESRKILRTQPKYSCDRLDDNVSILKDALQIKNFKSSLCLKMVRTKLVKDAFSDDARNIRVNEDVLISLLIALRCYQVIFTDNVVYNVLQRSNSISRSVNPNLLTVNNLIFTILKTNLENMGVFAPTENEFYFGYSKSMLYALAVCAQKVDSIAQFAELSSRLNKDFVLGLSDRKKNSVKFPRIFYFLVFALKHKRFFYIANKILKPFLKY